MPRPTSSGSASRAGSGSAAARREKARLRLSAQGLDGAKWDSPEDAVRAFGVMQGQDFASVYRSVALRTAGTNVGLRCELVDAALASGALVRGYPMRSTVFLSHRADLRWISELCVKPTQHDEIGPVRDAVLAHGQPMSRKEFKALVEELLPEAIPYRVLRQLLEDNVVVYQGVDQQITAFPEDASSPGLDAAFNGDRVAATIELLTRYVRTHGPVTVRDFAWWTKLPLKLIREAARHLPADIEWSTMACGTHGEPEMAPVGLEGTSKSVHLLGAFDEYILGYQDRLFAMTPDMHEVVVPKNMGVFRKTIVVDGQVRGVWTKQGIEDLGVPKYALAKVRRAYAAALGGAETGSR